MQQLKTYMQPKAEVTRQWHLADAQNQVLGRFASTVAQKLIGKLKKTYTPHIDGGDYVVVVNAEKIATTNNPEKKLYYSHSGYPGALKSKTQAELLREKPEEVIRKAVYNMLPKNKLRSGRMNRLKIYRGSEHPHGTHFSA